MEDANERELQAAIKVVTDAKWPEGWTVALSPNYESTWNITIKIPDAIWQVRLGVLLWGGSGQDYECCLSNGKTAFDPDPVKAVRMALATTIAEDANVIAAKALGLL